MIGRACIAALKEDGHEVARLVRGEAVSPDELSWYPAAGDLPLEACREFNAIINLCGAPIAGARWTARVRNELRASRIDATQALAKVFQSPSLAGHNGPQVLINASATGIYGDRGNLELNESTGPGSGFLAGLCRDWEDAAMMAGESGARVVCLRFGMVLSHEGGALQRMIPFYRAGLGCSLGTGRQWMSWISLEDAVGVVRFALSNSALAGPVNVVSPDSVTNSGFTRALGRIFGRQLAMPLPRLMLRITYGALADETLLASARVVPAKLVKAGYPFRYRNLEDALYQALAMEKTET
jgi:uncharacterized protein (TIGR01777 family)